MSKTSVPEMGLSMQPHAIVDAIVDEATWQRETDQRRLAAHPGLTYCASCGALWVTLPGDDKCTRCMLSLNNDPAVGRGLRRLGVKGVV